jgi:hypothetical protein
MATLIHSTARNKLIFACHGIASEDKIIEVPFEFSSIYFFCDLGFTLIQPINLLNGVMRPDLLVDSICQNKLIPRRLDSNRKYTNIIRMDEEIGKLKYRPDEGGKIQLNYMRFRISMRDRSTPFLYQNFGVYFCNAAGEIRKILGFDELYGMLEAKAREKRQPVEIAVFTYNDVFGLLRDVTARLRIDPTNTDIAMFSCRSFSPSSPEQIPLSTYRIPPTYKITGGSKRNLSDEYSNMLFLESGVAMVSEEIFNRYNTMQPYNPEFIPIANNFVKLLVEYNNERRNVKMLKESGEESIYRTSLPIEVAGGSKRSKKYRSKLNKYRKRHNSRTASMKRKRTSKHKKSLSKRRK